MQEATGGEDTQFEPASGIRPLSEVERYSCWIFSHPVIRDKSVYTLANIGTKK